MENNNEVMSLNESDVIISKYDFERVDFNIPATIMSYGHEVRDKISEVLKRTAEISDGENEIVLDLNEIRKMLDLDASLDESDKNSNKKDLAVVTNIKKLLTKVGIKKFEEDEKNNSYAARYSAYLNSIKEITEAIESQKNATIKEFNIKTGIINDLQPLVEELDEIIAAGKVDLQKFESEVNELKQKHEVEGGADLYREIQVKSMFIVAFKSKLDELERECTLYKEQIQAYNLQLSTDMVTVSSQETYITAIGPVLAAQGSVEALSRQQNKRLKQVQGLNDLANEMILKNASELRENSERAKELYVNGGISTSTLKGLKESLAEGFNIYNNAKSQKIEKIEKDRLELQKIQESLAEFTTSISTLINDESVYKQLTDGASSGPVLGRRKRY